MSYQHEESEIIRDADQDGSLKNTPTQVWRNRIASYAEEMRDGDSTKDDEWLIGELGRLQILLCASLDVDYTECIMKRRMDKASG